MLKRGRVSSRSELDVLEFFIKQGYDYLHRGWPDFLFYKDGSVIFVEVKRKSQKRVKVHQRMVIDILKQLGLDVRVCYGIKADGSPNYEL